ncbi:nuA3 HAT complex component nto1 [Blyttiomyces sp. JEL0837]|nr:nuA3 HAT complex component nto1 [Blyttiomyces sp. JEL0837]
MDVDKVPPTSSNDATNRSVNNSTESNDGSVKENGISTDEVLKSMFDNCEDENASNGHISAASQDSNIAVLETPRDIYGDIPLQEHFPSFLIQPSKPVPVAVFETVEPPDSSDDDNPTFSKKSVFKYPEAHYFRYVEPTERELGEVVEYDMDEQDLCWLNLVNSERQKSGDPEVSASVFELAMDRLEKEWFDLIKDLPKPAREELGPEDTVCVICEDGECENSNAIVFCDGCNIAVHQDCYGVPYIPEGQWLCRKCMLSPEKPVTCIFCPSKEGAFKQTITNRWANGSQKHILQMSSTWSQLIQLRIFPKADGSFSKNCYTAYHVTCAKAVKLYMKTKVNSPDDIVMKSYCDKHTLKEHRENHDIDALIASFRSKIGGGTTGKFGGKKSKSKETPYVEEVEDEDFDAISSKKPRRRRTLVVTDSESEDQDVDRFHKSAAVTHLDSLTHLQRYRKMQACPIVPIVIFRKVLAAIKTSVRKRVQFVELVCRYWALKRESRRGAPLLKRLHLEPWTATASAIQVDEDIKAKKYEILRYIRNDLERVRLLAELVKKREKEKLKRARLHLEYLEIIMHPVTHVLRPIFEEIRRLDSKSLFQHPVSRLEVPDYYQFVKNPMDFSTMFNKLDMNEYRSIEAFEADVELICSNALIYNQPDTPWGRAAPRIRSRMKPLIHKAVENLAKLPVNPETSTLNLMISDEWSLDCDSGGDGKALSGIVISETSRRVTEMAAGALHLPQGKPTEAETNENIDIEAVSAEENMAKETSNVIESMETSDGVESMEALDVVESMEALDVVESLDAMMEVDNRGVSDEGRTGTVVATGIEISPLEEDDNEGQISSSSQLVTENERDEKIDSQSAEVHEVSSIPVDEVEKSAEEVPIDVTTTETPMDITATETSNDVIEENVEKASEIADTKSGSDALVVTVNSEPEIVGVRTLRPRSITTTVPIQKARSVSPAKTFQSSRVKEVTVQEDINDQDFGRRMKRKSSASHRNGTEEPAHATLEKEQNADQQATVRQLRVRRASVSDASTLEKLPQSIIAPHSRELRSRLKSKAEELTVLTQTTDNAMSSRSKRYSSRMESNGIPHLEHNNGKRRSSLGDILNGETETSLHESPAKRMKPNIVTPVKGSPSTQNEQGIKSPSVTPSSETLNEREIRRNKRLKAIEENEHGLKMALQRSMSALKTNEGELPSATPKSPTSNKSHKTRRQSLPSSLEDPTTKSSTELTEHPPPLPPKPSHKKRPVDPSIAAALALIPRRASTRHKEIRNSSPAQEVNPAVPEINGADALPDKAPSPPKVVAHSQPTIDPSRRSSRLVESKMLLGPFPERPEMDFEKCAELWDIIWELRPHGGQE